MAKIAYIQKKFSYRTKSIITTASAIIEEYQKQGFTLTLRQLFYQFVARGYLENTERSYQRLGGIISDGRRAGLLDWESIEDRTRFVRDLSHWENPSGIIRSAWKSFRLSMWEEQAFRLEVWIEKDALLGVIDQVCEMYDVPYFSCKGYVSDSEIWRAGNRIIHNEGKIQKTIILHLGDHDPSGIDMTRDINTRLDLFSDFGSFEVRRLALNMNQIQQYNPPPNPAKVTDSRYSSYTADYGPDSWELDALSPPVLYQLIEDEIINIVDHSVWNRTKQRENQYKKELELASDNWETVIQSLKEK